MLLFYIKKTATVRTVALLIEWTVYMRKIESLIRLLKNIANKN
jgi:hypothetical protein